jgi:hypothetical protein
LIGVTRGQLGETITYSRLNRIDPNPGFPTKFVTHGFDEPEQFDFYGFPLMMATHATWQPFWDDIADTVFIYRSPLDALISLWYHEVKFTIAPVETIGLDEFVLKCLPDWIERHVGCANISVRLRYEDLMIDALHEYETAIRALGVKFEPNNLGVAVAMTSFEAVRQMEDRHQEWHGHRANDGFRAQYKLSGWVAGEGVRFARSGEIGQWTKELRQETIDTAIEALGRAGLGNLIPTR